MSSGGAAEVAPGWWNLQYSKGSTWESAGGSAEIEESDEESEESVVECPGMVASSVTGSGASSGHSVSMASRGST